MRKMIVAIAVAGLALAGCSSGETAAETPTDREEACEVIQQLTPGSLELSWNAGVMADEGATSEERQEALHSQLFGDAKDAEDEPYACEGPVFERFLADHYSD